MRIERWSCSAFQAVHVRDVPAVVANVALMPSMSVECKEAFRTQLGTKHRHVADSTPASAASTNRRPRAVGIGRVVTAEDETGLRIAKKCARTRPVADRPG